jgi:hypothetical protein
VGAFLILPLFFHLIPNQPPSALVPVAPTLGELQEWQDIAKVREDKIRELESLNKDLRHDNRILTVVFFFTFGKIRLTLLIAKCSLERCLLRNGNLQGIH